MRLDMMSWFLNLVESSSLTDGVAAGSHVGKGLVSALCIADSFIMLVNISSQMSWSFYDFNDPNTKVNLSEIKKNYHVGIELCCCTCL